MNELPVIFLTIVLDGMPWIKHHLPVMRKLPFTWTWLVVEGVADNVACTSWCQDIPARLSQDGTHEYLSRTNGGKLNNGCLIHICKAGKWAGKVAMCNEVWRFITKPTLLVQIDSDECWSTEQLIAMREMFLEDPSKNSAYFWCDYRVGPDIRITTRDTYGNYSSYEWLRAWRVLPGMIFASHEPPRIAGFELNPFTHAETEARGLVFRHEAYSTEAQLAFKQLYYGRESGKYKNAVADWKRLQAATDLPCQLKRYLPWVDEQAIAARI